MKSYILSLFFMVSTLSMAKTTDQLKNEAESYLETHVLYDDGSCYNLENGQWCDSEEYYEVLSISDELNGIVGHKSILKKFGDTIYHPIKELGRETGLNGHKDINICGVKLVVPTVFYLTCISSAYLLPEGCTAGAAITAGGACAANIAIVAAACGITIAKVGEIAKECIAGH